MVRSFLSNTRDLTAVRESAASMMPRSEMPKHGEVRMGVHQILPQVHAALHADGGEIGQAHILGLHLPGDGAQVEYPFHQRPELDHEGVIQLVDAPKLLGSPVLRPVCTPLMSSPSCRVRCMSAPC
jgi:hypothetical protein